MREIRRELRELPRERRRDIGSAIRSGRAVTDPRDAELATAWAERLALAPDRKWWPWWLIPRRRPHGWRAWLWTLHLAWIAGAVVYAWTTFWPSIPGIWRWVTVGFFAYGAVSAPFTLRMIIRAYRNAPQAARRNRELLRADQQPASERASEQGAQG